VIATLMLRTFDYRGRVDNSVARPCLAVLGYFEYGGINARIGRSTVVHAPVRSHQQTKMPTTTSAPRELHHVFLTR
jgi:hypothetical protein